MVSFASTSALASRSRCTATSWPFSAARCSGVWPRKFWEPPRCIEKKGSATTGLVSKKQNWITFGGPFLSNMLSRIFYHVVQTFLLSIAQTPGMKQEWFKLRVGALIFKKAISCSPSKTSFCRLIHSPIHADCDCWQTLPLSCQTVSTNPLERGSPLLVHIEGLCAGLQYETLSINPRFASMCQLGHQQGANFSTLSLPVCYFCRNTNLYVLAG